MALLSSVAKMPTPVTLPIRETDEQIRAAIGDAHFPSLAAAIVHLTGDTRLIRESRPFYDFFGEGQGGFSPERKARAGGAAIAALTALRDRGGGEARSVRQPRRLRQVPFARARNRPARRQKNH